MKKSAWNKLTSGTLSAVMAFSAGASFALKTGAEWWDTPGHNTSGIRGDVNYSGKVDVFDLVDARSLLIAQFSGSSSPIDLNAADLDGNGYFAVNDLLLLSQFIMGQVRTFPEVTTTTTAVQTELPVTTTTSVNYSGDSFMGEISQNMVLKAPDGFNQMRPGTDYGVMEHKSYFSKDAGMTKNVNILLPPGYGPNESYPVLYVLHGIFGDENSMPGMGIQTMAGNLMASGDAVKMIIVFPAMFTGQGFPGFDSESAKKYDLIREDIENSLMPFLAENYSIKTGRENTAITGFSMGGREALYTGVTRSQMYGYVGAACPAPGIFPTRDNYMEHQGCMSPGEFKPDTPPRMLLISAAAFDGTVGTYPQSYHEALENNGAEHLWQVIPDGDHGGATVTPHMYNFLRYVFK